MSAHNPWLDIPAEDYIAHMSSPAVNQRPVLSRLLGEALERAQPRRVLLLGGATGNGLEHVDAHVTRQVVVLDVNPAYLRGLTGRFPDPPFDLVVHCADLDSWDSGSDRFDLIHAGLVLEYVDWRSVFSRAARALTPHGLFSIVLQLPSASTPAVTPTGFASLRRLEPLFHFVEPDALADVAGAEGLRVDRRRTEPLPGGKSFEVLWFQPGR
jgi:SAM-dependent methyltransferase